MSESRTAQVDSILPLRSPVFEILLALGEGPRHGYGIIQALRKSEGPQLRLETGPLYRHLKRLLEQGLIEESDDPPEGTRDDQRRKAYYALTDLGKAVVRAEAARLSGLVQHTQRLGFTAEPSR